MCKIYDTFIYICPDQVVFCGEDTSFLFHTQNEVLQNKSLLDEIYPELCLKILSVLQNKYMNKTLVKVLSKDLYKALWESEDPMVTRFYDDSKITQEDLYKELEKIE